MNTIDNITETNQATEAQQLKYSANPFGQAHNMKLIYKTQAGVEIMGAWMKDPGTMERRLALALVYPSGEVSPMLEYAPSKLTNPKALMNLADLEGMERMDPENAQKLLKRIRQAKLDTLDGGSDKCSLQDVYQELVDYVERYEEPGKVFIRDGYGCILSKEFPKVLERLEVGYTRLEVQKNFKAWGLLKTSEKSSHAYVTQVNLGGKRGDWFVSFKLPDTDGDGGAAA